MFPRRICGSVARNLWDYATDRMSGERAARVAQHLQECAACRERAQQVAQIMGTIRADRQRPLPDYPNRWPAIHSGLDAVSEAATGHRSRSLRFVATRPALIWGGIAFTLAALTGGAGLVGRHHATLPRPQAPLLSFGNDRHSPIDSATWDSAIGRTLPTMRSNQSPHAVLPTAPPWDVQRIKPGSTLYSNRLDDMKTVNAEPVRSLLLWTSAPQQDDAELQRSVDQMIKTGDDFVSVPFPQIAASGSQGMRAALAAYQHEKEIMDPRLARRISLSVKATAFSDLCRQLTQMTDISLHVQRGLGDEKVTLFCHELPLRDIMSQITRVFGYTWLRSEVNDAFEYELVQSMRAQLTEEEMRNRDFHAALLALDTEMKKRTEEEEAQKEHRYSQWGILQLYSRLSPTDFTALRDGQTLLFSTGNPNPDRALPEDLRAPILRTMAGNDISESATSRALVSFHLAQIQPGQVSLQEAAGFRFPDPRGIETGSGGELAFGNPLAAARSPESQHPDNDKFNAAARNLPLFQKKVLLQLKSSCHRKQQLAARVDDPAAPFEERMEARRDPPGDHVSSADVWEEVHRKTGLPIIADAYTHLYAFQAFPKSEKPLFDVLCQIGDVMRAHWKKDGDFIQCRSVTFFWDKLQEVPNRYLARWRADKERAKTLPFDDLLEISTLSDAQLDSLPVLQGIQHCEGLEEFGLLYGDSSGLREFVMMRRNVIRFLAGIPSALRQHALDEKGLAFSELSAPQQQALFPLLEGSGFTFQDAPASRLRVEYVPPGNYVWNPRDAFLPGGDTSMRQPLISAKTPEEALKAAQKVDPKTTEHNIRLSRGVLAITLYSPDGRVWGFGKPMGM